MMLHRTQSSLFAAVLMAGAFFGTHVPADEVTGTTTFKARDLCSAGTIKFSNSCGPFPPSAVVRIYEGEIMDWGAAGGPVPVYLCAAEAIGRMDGYGREAELELIERAIEAARQRNDQNQIVKALQMKALFFARHDEVSSFVEVWDEIGALMQGAVMFIDGHMKRFACAAYEAGELDLAIRLISRFQKQFDDRGDNTDLGEPHWLPDLYAAAGQVDRAEEIHLRRIERVRAKGSRPLIASYLDHYAKFLASAGRMGESDLVAQEAESLRQQALVLQTAEGYWERLEEAAECEIHSVHGGLEDLDVIERSIETAREQKSEKKLEEAFLEKALYFAERDDVTSFVEVWDEIVSLAPNVSIDALIAMTRFACYAYEAGDLNRALELVSRIEAQLGDSLGRRRDEKYGEPTWLPDLYAAAGQVDRAEEIHRRRIRWARANELGFITALRLKHYAKFLASQRRTRESETAAQEAERLFQEARRIPTTDGDRDPRDDAD